MVHDCSETFQVQANSEEVNGAVYEVYEGTCGKVGMRIE
jgi:hypothetical protein